MHDRVQVSPPTYLDDICTFTRYDGAGANSLQSIGVRCALATGDDAERRIPHGPPTASNVGRNHSCASRHDYALSQRPLFGMIELVRVVTPARRSPSSASTGSASPRRGRRAERRISRPGRRPGWSPNVTRTSSLAWRQDRRCCPIGHSGGPSSFTSDPQPMLAHSSQRPP